MKKHYLKLLFLCFYLLSLQFSYAQECSYNTGATLVGDATPSACDGAASGNINMVNGQYATVNVICGNLYTFDMCGSTADTQIDLWTTNGGTFLANDDDGCGLQSTVTWQADFTGVVEVHMASYGGLFNLTSCTTDGSDSAPLVVTCQELVKDIVTCGTPANYTYCYDDDLLVYILFESFDGISPLTLTFNAGGIEATYDELTIYDGKGDFAPVLFTGDNGGDLTGLTVTSTSPNLFMLVSTDGSVSCVGGGITPQWDWTVECQSTCDIPVATATYDCFTNDLTLNVSYAGVPSGATPYTLSVTGGPTVPSQTLSGTGNYTFSGLTNNVTYTVIADDGAGCVVTVTSILADCPCQNPVGTATYDCFTNEITVSVSDAGVAYDPTNNPYVISVTGGPAVAGQAITGVGNYTFTGLTANTNYTIAVDDGAGCNATLATVFEDCSCLAPVGTATYDCAGDFIELNISNTGAPTGAFSASLDGGTPVNINSTGIFNFSGLAQDQTYNLVFDDGAGCTSSIPYIYNGCRTIGNSCTSAMSNGGFEDNNSVWDESVTDGNNINANFNLIVNSDLPLSGTNSAVFGGYGGSGLGTGSPYTSSLERETLSGGVLLPNGDIITLYLWILIDACTPGDQFTITVDGNVVLSINGTSSQCGEDKWREYAIDLSAYADGMRHPLVFELIENSTTSPTRIYLDNLLVESCTPVVCPPNLTGGNAIFGSPADQTDYETDGSILSIQTIAAGTTIDYDSATDITLGIAGSAGFEVQLGATFCAFIDGCNGTGGAINTLTDGNISSLQVEDTDKKTSTKVLSSKNESITQPK